MTVKRAVPRVPSFLQYQSFAQLRGLLDNGIPDAIASLRPAVSSPLGRNTVWNFLSQLLNAALGIAVYSLLTRALPVESFGTYSFLLAFFLFSSTFFDFGLASSGMRLLAIAEDEASRRKRSGALILLSMALGVLLAIFVALVSPAVDLFFHAGAGQLILMLTPLVIVFPLQEIMVSIGQGSGRIRFLSAFLLLPRLLLLGMLLPLYLTGSLTLVAALMAALMAMLLAVTIATGYLRPSFRGLRPEFTMVRKELREFGRQVYAGRVVDGLTTGLDKILLSRFHGMTLVGYYSIAYTMSLPILMFSRAVSSSAYKSFAEVPQLPRRVLFANFVWCTLGAVVLVAACDVLVPLLFTSSYAPSLAALPLLASGIALAGLNQPFHAFLLAQRQGRSVKIMSVTTSALLVLLNLALIPTLRMEGAALALIGTYGVNIFMNIYFYRGFRENMRQQEDNDAAV